jgi:hypothetical protein
MIDHKKATQACIGEMLDHSTEAMENLQGAYLDLRRLVKKYIEASDWRRAMIDKSMIKRLAVQCELSTSDDDGISAHDVRLERFAHACYAQGREDMHRLVMETRSAPFNTNDLHISERLRSLE